MAKSFELKGVPEVLGTLKKIEGKLPRNVGRALYEEALIEQKESMARTPVEFGTLRNSHETSFPSYKGDEVSVEIKVGGPAAPYAVAVHERLDVHHKAGQAKFLESTLLGSAKYMLQRIATRLEILEGAK